MKTNSFDYSQNAGNKESQLVMAENFSRKYVEEVNRSGQRQAFHFSPSVGWMNDPNGFSFYKGKIQLFYQYNPYSIDWDTMHWGHASSDDFVKWKYEKVALAPDMPYDDAKGGGCFSGSAIEFGGKYWLAYTGVGYDNKIEKLVQTSCLAYSEDGINFTKYKNNPVIAQGKGLPEDSRPTDFRDPKIWEHAGYVYMIISAGNKYDDYASLLLYRTTNMTEWHYAGKVYSNASERPELGTMMECPDLFRLDDTDIIITCPMNMPGNRNQNGCIYLTGQFDYTTGTFSQSKNLPAREVDGGFDFYAPQTMLHPDGRRVIIAWMHSFSRRTIGSLLDYRYASSMTFPRELHIENGMLRQWPVREIEQYYSPAVTIVKTIKGDCIFVPELDGTCMNLSLEFTPSAKTGIVVFADKRGKGLQIYYRNGKVFLDRSEVYSSKYPESGLITCVPAPLINGKVKIRMLLDKISAEIFVGNGQYAMTANVMTGKENYRTALLSENSVAFCVVKNKIII